MWRAATPRSRARLLLKGLEYVPSAARLLRRVRALGPDVAHVQWLAIPRYDVHWLGRLRAPLVLTAHDGYDWPAIAGAAKLIIDTRNATGGLGAAANVIRL